MSIEATEVVVNRGGVEKRSQSIRERLRQAMLILMKNVQVIFKTEHRRTRK